MLDTTQALKHNEPIDVLVVGRSARLDRRVRVHRTSQLAHQDIRWRAGIPVTSPARTLLDLAATMNQLELEAVLSAAFRMKLVRRPQLADVMQRNPHANGSAKLRALLQQTESPADTRSRYERKFRELLRQAELPTPLANTWIAGKFVDGVWPDLGLVFEIDGFGVHGQRAKFESDRVRDQHLMIAEHRVIRVTARQIDHGAYALIARTASIITALRLKTQQSPAAPLPTSGAGPALRSSVRP